MSVVEAVQGEIDAIGDKAAGSAMAATALALAAELDGSNSATSKSMCAKALVDVLRELRALAPPKETEDELSRLRNDRERRRAGLAAAQDQART